MLDELLEDLGNHGLLNASEDGAQWHRPPVESSEAVQLSLLARVTVPIIERYYLAISLLLAVSSLTSTTTGRSYQRGAVGPGSRIGTASGLGSLAERARR